MPVSETVRVQGVKGRVHRAEGLNVECPMLNNEF